MYFNFKWRKKSKNAKSRSRTVSKNWFLLALPLTIVGIYRITHYLFINIPNEERSLFICGTEVHHAITGTILLLLTFFYHYIRGAFSSIYLFFIVLFSTSFIDQVYFIQLADVSDELYNTQILIFNSNHWGIIIRNMDI